MAVPGRKPKPPLQVVREGNPGKRPVKEGVRLPPAEICEPDWLELFPDVKVPARPRAPKDASEEDMVLYRAEVRAWQRIKQNAADAARCRQVASREWRRVVPGLQKNGGVGA